MRKMELEEYLKELEECPDSLLKEKCGVYGKWPVYLDIPMKKIAQELQDSGKFELEENYKWRRIGYSRLSYMPGTVELILSEITPKDSKFVVSCLLGKDTKTPKLGNYRTVLTLHPRQSNKTEDVFYDRELAAVFKEIAKYVKKREIDACFLNPRIASKNIFYFHR
jgi:hypothetical protein